MLAAYVYNVTAAEKRAGFKARLEVHGLDNGRRSILSSHLVPDRKEARKLAKQMGAQPWNF